MSYGPNGEPYFSATSNCFVHVIMYSYYFLTYSGSAKLRQVMDKYKFNLTYLQLAQFFLNITEIAYNRYNHCDKFPLWIQWTFLGYMFSMILLFANFLLRSKPGREKQE